MLLEMQAARERKERIRLFVVLVLSVLSFSGLIVTIAHITSDGTNPSSPACSHKSRDIATGMSTILLVSGIISVVAGLNRRAHKQTTYTWSTVILGLNFLVWSIAGLGGLWVYHCGT